MEQPFRNNSDQFGVNLPVNPYPPSSVLGTSSVQAPSDITPTVVKDLPPHMLVALRGSLVKMARAQGNSPQDADDIAQEALLRGLDAGKIRSPRAWFHTVVKHLTITQLRTTRRRLKKLGQQVSLDQARGMFDPSAERNSEELRETVEAAVQRLPLEHEGVVRCILKGYTYPETAEALCLPTHTVSYRYKKARKRLAEILKSVVGE